MRESRIKRHGEPPDVHVSLACVGSPGCLGLRHRVHIRGANKQRLDAARVVVHHPGASRAVWAPLAGASWLRAARTNKSGSANRGSSAMTFLLPLPGFLDKRAMLPPPSRSGSCHGLRSGSVLAAAKRAARLSVWRQSETWRRWLAHIAASTSRGVWANRGQWSSSTSMSNNFACHDFGGRQPNSAATLAAAA